jgi:1,5-anhydro-D-fructose reductase (1,5-anhydro-D-mannitol-forming)
MIRIGIIGFGKMGHIRYNAICANGAGEVVAVADVRVNDVDVQQVRVYTNADELVADPQIDAVFICTPNYLNKPLTIKALRAGKHVFCEKPPAFNSKEVEEIIAAEQQSPGTKLMYGFNHRHHDSVIQAKELVDSGAYGRILWMRGRYGKSVDESFYDDWRSKKEFAGGGILMDQGIHMLDLFLMMAGDFHEVQAYVSNLYWNLDVEDNIFAILRSKDGLLASLHATMTQWRHLFSFEMFLEEGYIVINGLLTSSRTYGEESLTIAKNRSTAPAATWSDEEHIVFCVDNSWKYEVEHFLNAIENDKDIEVGTSKDALKIICLVEDIYHAGSN